MDSTPKRIEDAIAIAIGKNRRSHMRKAERRKQETRAIWLLPELKCLCDEYGQKLNTPWTGKDWGSARNFIDECEASGENATAILRNVVKNWPRMVEGAILNTRNRRPIIFPRAVDFGHFFKYRREVTEWLKHIGDRPAREYVVTEINLRREK